MIECPMYTAGFHAKQGDVKVTRDECEGRKDRDKLKRPCSHFKGIALPMNGCDMILCTYGKEGDEFASLPDRTHEANVPSA